MAGVGEARNDAGAAYGLVSLPDDDLYAANTSHEPAPEGYVRVAAGSTLLRIARHELREELPQDQLSQGLDEGLVKARAAEICSLNSARCDISLIGSTEMRVGNPHYLQVDWLLKVNASAPDIDDPAYKKAKPASSTVAEAAARAPQTSSLPDRQPPPAARAADKQPSQPLDMSAVEITGSQPVHPPAGKPKSDPLSHEVSSMLDEALTSPVASSADAKVAQETPAVTPTPADMQTTADRASADRAAALDRLIPPPVDVSKSLVPFPHPQRPVLLVKPLAPVPATSAATQPLQQPAAQAKAQGTSADSFDPAPMGVPVKVPASPMKMQFGRRFNDLPLASLKIENAVQLEAQAHAQRAQTHQRLGETKISNGSLQPRGRQNFIDCNTELTKVETLLGPDAPPAAQAWLKTQRADLHLARFDPKAAGRMYAEVATMSDKQVLADPHFRLALMERLYATGYMELALAELKASRNQAPAGGISRKELEDDFRDVIEKLGDFSKKRTATK